MTDTEEKEVRQDPPAELTRAVVRGVRRWGVSNLCTRLTNAHKASGRAGTISWTPVMAAGFGMPVLPSFIADIGAACEALGLNVLDSVEMVNETLAAIDEAERGVPVSVLLDIPPQAACRDAPQGLGALPNVRLMTADEIARPRPIKQGWPEPRVAKPKGAVDPTTGEAARPVEQAWPEK